MTFHSILFDAPDGNARDEAIQPPAFLSDLNLDQVIEAITASKQEYHLKPFFYAPARSVETIRYRQEIMRDLEDETLQAYFRDFAEKMVLVRRYRSMIEKLDFERHKKGWFLEMALVYSSAVSDLARHLNQANLGSQGLLGFRQYVTEYVAAEAFQALAAEARQVQQALSAVTYSLIIRPGQFSVQRYEGEAEYSVQVEDTFAKFKETTGKQYLARLNEWSGMSHVEAKILEFVARLYPEPFAALDRFCEGHRQFVDQAILVFDREIQFYLAYLEFIAPLKRQGLPFCYPQVSPSGREVYTHDGFDLALAYRLLQNKGTVTPNDFFLNPPERVLVVSGPNQGGKTTFARMFGQLHYLAGLGCSTPGREARLTLFDQIFTHFEREEDIRNLRGKLEDDLVRIREILAQATAQSILIVNEMFASTALQDAVFLSKEIMAKVLERDCLCVWVTFLDELSRLSEKTVSMVSTVDPQNSAVRTFKILRRPADGLAYALSLVEKHRLTYRQLLERIPR